MVIAQRSVWPGLSREGQYWVRGFGNHLQRQINTAFGQNSQGRTSAILDAAVSQLSRGEVGMADMGQSHDEDWGWGGLVSCR